MDKKTKTDAPEEIFGAFKFEHFQDPASEDLNKNLVTDLSGLDEEEIETQITAAKEKAAKVADPKKVKPEVPVEEDEDDTEEEEEEVETSEDDEPAAPKNEDDEDEEVEISFKPLVEALAEKGILNYNTEDEFEDSDEGLENVIINTIKAGIQEYKETLPEVVKELTDFIELGGDIGSYLQAKSNITTLENFDISSEENQEKVVRAFLKTQEYTEDEVDEAIKDYQDSLMLDKEAKRALTKLKKIAEKEESELLTRQEELEAEQRKQYTEYVSTLKETISKSDNIAGLKLNERDKKAFSEYLTKVDRNGKTDYAKDLEKDYMNNSIALAYFKFKNFNFSDIEKKVEKKVTKDIKSKMFSKTTKTIKSSNRTPHEGSDTESFSAFKNIWGQE